MSSLCPFFSVEILRHLSFLLFSSYIYFLLAILFLSMVFNRHDLINMAKHMLVKPVSQCCRSNSLFFRSAYWSSLLTWSTEILNLTNIIQFKLIIMSLPISQLIPFKFSSFSCWYQILHPTAQARNLSTILAPSLTHLSYLIAKFWWFISSNISQIYPLIFIPI